MLNVAERCPSTPSHAVSPSAWNPLALDLQVGAWPAGGGLRVWRLLPHWGSLLRALSLQGPLSWQVGQGRSCLSYLGETTVAPERPGTLRAEGMALDACTEAWGWAYVVQTPDPSGHRQHRLALFDVEGLPLLTVQWPLDADPDRLARLLARWGDPCLRPQFKTFPPPATAAAPGLHGRQGARVMEDLLLADVLHAAHLQGLSLTVRSADAPAQLSLTGAWRPPVHVRGQQVARTVCGQKQLHWEDAEIGDILLCNDTRPGGVRTWLACTNRQGRSLLTLHPVDTPAERCCWQRLVADLHA